jgi:eukaryotic-like serine/threonine-protein kinase
MSPERLQQIEELYHSIREREPSDREAYLAESCSGDQELRREVESLLAESDSRELFHKPALEILAGLLPNPNHRTRLAAGRRLGPYEICRFDRRRRNGRGVSRQRQSFRA